MSPENKGAANQAPVVLNAEERLAEVYLQELPQLIGIAMRNGISTDAEDVAQDSAIRALVAIRNGRYEDRGNLPGYLKEIAKNGAIDRKRASSRLLVADFDESLNKTDHSNIMILKDLR